MRIKPWAALLALALVAAACEGARSGAERPGEAGAGVKGGTLRVIDQSDVEAFDPGIAYGAADLALLRGVARELSSYDPRLPDERAATPVPDLADGPYQLSADGRAYTFRIRRGVNYAPPVNREVRAADFVYAVERQFDRRNPSPNPYAWLIRGVAAFAAGKARTISGLQALDDHTLRITLDRPASDFPSILTLPFFSPVPKEYASRYRPGPDYARHVVGSGPYTLRRYQPGSVIELVRNQNWDPRTDPLRSAWVDAITVRILGNRGGQRDIQRAIERGDADLGPPRAPGDQLRPRQAGGGAGARRPLRRRPGLHDPVPHPGRLQRLRPVPLGGVPRRPGAGQGAAGPRRLPAWGDAQLRRPVQRPGAGAVRGPAVVAGPGRHPAEPDHL